MSQYRWRAGAISLSLAATVVGGTSMARASEPTYVPWTDLLPSWTNEFIPTSENICVAGKPNCVKSTIREMQRRFAPLAKSCSHQAIFSLAYLRTTQEYARTAADPDFFDDTAFVNHEDAVFAKYYFDAYDAWSKDRLHKVPAAWRIALDAGRDRRVSGSGNLFLGMNAHVNRDLPFVLAAIGLANRKGESRKPDHDRVNEFLNRVAAPLMAELTRRFDPTMDDTSTPFGVTYTAMLQVLFTWRETAWRNAERLVNAPNQKARARVAQEIEDYAAANAQSLVETYSYKQPLQTSSDRDRYCAARAD